MAGKVEEIGNRIVDGDETLKLARRLEALHDLFSSSGRLVGILGSVIKPLVPAMLDARHHFSAGHGIGTELVGDHHTWGTALSFQELSHQPPCGLGVSAALHQHVEDEAILVDVGRSHPGRRPATASALCRQC